MITKVTTPELSAVPLLPPGIQPEEVLFFDIETTGFAADVTTLYLIGCIRLIEGRWTLTQWFADDAASEAMMLTEFFTLAEQYSCILHYNGSGFDLPYLAKKCEKYHFDYAISSKKSYDVYKLLQPFRHLPGLKNLKQKSVEQYLDISRQDCFSGGELIQYYSMYLKAKYAHLPEEQTYLDMLLLHNAEDLIGLFSLTLMLALPAMLTDAQVDQSATLDMVRGELTIPLTLLHPLPKPLYLRTDQMSLSASDRLGKLRITLCQQELKFFYSNYKDYYYLPEEDMAIHKSVAFYVDKEYRTKAKAANCYSRHTGCFVPQYQEITEPFFKVEYADHISWLEATPEFCQDTELLTKYARHLLIELMHSCNAN